MVSAIVVSYNTRELLAGCLQSLHRSLPSPAVEVIVYDNASEDGSAEMVAEAWRQVKLMAGERNIGFGPATNRAAAMARGEWLLLLNSDAMVEPDTVQALVECARRNGSAIVGARLVGPDGRFQSSARTFPSALNLLLEAVGLDLIVRRTGHYGFRGDRCRVVDYVSGAAMLIRRDTWEQLGGFDERFFFYGEDADLCYRARQRGLVTRFCAEATAIHIGGASSASLRSNAALEGYRSVFLFIRKHRGVLALCAARLAVALGAAARWVPAALLGLVSGSAPRAARRDTYARVLRLALSKNPMPVGGFGGV